MRHPLPLKARNVLLVSLLAVVPSISIAEVKEVKITVAVVVPLCIINNNYPIWVDFGQIDTSKINGVNYQTPVKYIIACAGNEPDMKMFIAGEGASFDNELLQTNITGLGIKIQELDRKVKINSWIKFIYPDRPILTVTPVKQPGVRLGSGDFSAAAIMSVSYR